MSRTQTQAAASVVEAGRVMSGMRGLDPVGFTVPDLGQARGFSCRYHAWHYALDGEPLPVAPDRCVTTEHQVNRSGPATYSPEERQAMRERIALYAKTVRDEDYAATFSIQEGLASGANHEMLFGDRKSVV